MLWAPKRRTLLHFELEGNGGSGVVCRPIQSAESMTRHLQNQLRPRIAFQPAEVHSFAHIFRQVVVRRLQQACTSEVVPAS